MFIYLDNSSTTRQYKEVTEIMIRCMNDDFGNPSSLHKMGLTAENHIKTARKQLAASLNAMPEEIVFTSGGTESDNAAIFSVAETNKRRGNKLITSQVEHPAVLEAFAKLEKQGFKVTYLPVDKECKIKIEDYMAAIDEETILTSIMTVNNEVGTIMPIGELYKLKQKSVFHTDAVQGFGKVTIPKVDMISVSGHKIHGPKGIGALYIKKDMNFKPLILGGGQERGYRSGTENVPAIAGFGKAAEMKKDIGNIKDYLLNGLINEVKDIKVNSPEDGVSNILNISFLGTRSEVILHTLEQEGIFVSSGSACSSHKKGGSHVLKAMGLRNEEIESAIRFSFSEFNKIDEMDYVIDKVKSAVTRFRKLGSFR
ncbi:MAG: cysteine desulfurase family protein [Anaerovoracaceae bacterium]